MSPRSRISEKSTVGRPVNGSRGDIEVLERTPQGEGGGKDRGAHPQKSRLGRSDEQFLPKNKTLIEKTDTSDVGSRSLLP